MFVDVHAHLDDKAFDDDREQVLENRRGWHRSCKCRF